MMFRVLAVLCASHLMFGHALAQTPAVAASTPAAGTATPANAAQNAEGDDSLLAALRARVTGGAITFSAPPELVPTGEGANTRATFRSPQFSQASPYFAIEVQPELFRWRDIGTHPRWTVEPLVGFRMTAVPVSDGTDEESAGPKSPTVPDSAFLQSQKAAHVELGGLLAMHFGAHAIAGGTYHWSVGLSARRGFSSVTDSQRVQRVWDLDDDLFGSGMIGGRLTLLRQNDDDRWLPGAFIDAGVGRFESFEVVSPRTDAARACLANRNQCLLGEVPAQDDFTTQRKNRFYAEARLMLKHLYLGLDINNGAGRDDMRFVAGFTMALASLFGQ